MTAKSSPEFRIFGSGTRPISERFDLPAWHHILLYPLVMHTVEEYGKRLQDRKTRVAHNESIHMRVGNIRLLLLASAIAMAWASVRRNSFSPWWIVVPFVIYIFVAAYHSRVLRTQRLARRAVAFYSEGIARIEHCWAGRGQTGERFNDPHHVYSADLDLFGKGGLFELLSTARTRMGEETLAGWLLSPSAVEQLQERHAGIGELRGQIDFREDIAVTGEDIKVGVHPESLRSWAEASNRMGAPWIWWASLMLAILAIGGAVLWGTLGVATPFIVVLAIEALLRYTMRGRLGDVLQSSGGALQDLKLVSGILAKFEQHTFSTPRLQSLQRELWSQGVKSSRAIARLNTLVDLSDSRSNMILAVLDVPVMYSVLLAFATENWRRTHGKSVRVWLSVVGEMEALLSLATYSYEHPKDPFPDFKEGTACFEAKDIGHPLIPLETCVSNDVRLLDCSPVMLISGSNMSGKSTLMRTVGINAVLAMAGAPVRAKHLQMTPLQVGASIRVSDSLQEGSSRFYAEITRIRCIFDLAGNNPPCLFLLDELLQGTNSNDRRVGAEGIIRAMLKRNAIGMVSTHDLALADIQSPLGDQIRNVHFQEDFDGGKIQFDYMLRQGIVTKSNGVALMRSIGLDV